MPYSGNTDRGRGWRRQRARRIGQRRAIAKPSKPLVGAGNVGQKPPSFGAGAGASPKPPSVGFSGPGRRGRGGDGNAQRRARRRGQQRAVKSKQAMYDRR